eukprot:Nitzschia sp. Nitz4//scaffold45_size130396//7588//8139//NITZ4_003427-RA/size130396-processed-gene-0.171-mRNA-1//1//CDS//3329552332//6446//frame0
MSQQNERWLSPHLGLPAFHWVEQAVTAPQPLTSLWTFREHGNYHKYKEYLDRVANEGTADVEGANSQTVRWYKVHESISVTHTSATFNFSHLEVDRPGGPTVGRFPINKQMINHIRTKANRNWNAYEDNHTNATSSA